MIEARALSHDFDEEKSGFSRPPVVALRKPKPGMVK